jgi:replicative DNA helicase
VHSETAKAAVLHMWPSDIQEEKSALGVCLLGLATEAAGLLTPDDFSLTSHREILAAICELVSQGERAIEISLLAAQLRRRGTLEEIGDVAYLADLDYGVVPERPIASRLKVLREFATRRRVLTIAEEATRRASDLSQRIEETLAWLREAVG